MKKPHILAQEYAQRRQHLMKLMGKEAIALLPAASLKQRNHDAEYPFRQDSDFHYLTGFPEPDALLVLIPGRAAGAYILFCRERDAQMELWHGRRAGLAGARKHYGADEAYPITQLDELLPKLLENRRQVYYTLGSHAELDQKLPHWLQQLRRKARSGTHTPREIVDLAQDLHEMRLHKSPHEAEVMRHAAAIAVQAHKRAMRLCRPGGHEYQIEAELLHAFYQAGAKTSYNPIVAGGANACILHYTENNAKLRDGDLLLIDAGAEVDCYASDITRTFPINGRYSAPQKALYEIVLKAQDAAIAKVSPDHRWHEPHEAAVKALTQGLVRLGILRGPVKELIKDEAYRAFYMHRTGHWLGLDVHDAGEYKINQRWRRLESGMVLTVEPGLYIAPGSKGVDKQWWGIGIRIEDDVLVTPRGHEVLTQALPKSVAEIEALMAQK